MTFIPSRRRGSPVTKRLSHRQPFPRVRSRGDQISTCFSEPLSALPGLADLLSQSHHPQTLRAGAGRCAGHVPPPGTRGSSPSVNLDLVFVSQTAGFRVWASQCRAGGWVHLGCGTSALAWGPLGAPRTLGPHCGETGQGGSGETPPQSRHHPKLALCASLSLRSPREEALRGPGRRALPSPEQVAAMKTGTRTPRPLCAASGGPAPGATHIRAVRPATARLRDSPSSQTETLSP